ncbi:MAG: type II toxin-antitoxin system RelE/ParE family toxin [Roseburia sp.]|nr:type II toxin-antitoxin system RelE/ParE family toxin [Roseburia sp.]
MTYKVTVSDFAKRQLDNILFYICITLGNESAAKSVLQDAENTIRKLAHISGALKLCDEPELAQYGYRKIHFASHRYIMLYIIEKKRDSYRQNQP